MNNMRKNKCSSKVKSTKGTQFVYQSSNSLRILHLRLGVEEFIKNWFFFNHFLPQAITKIELEFFYY